MKNNRKTTHVYWDSMYAGQSLPNLPSRLSVGSRNYHRLFKRYIHAGMKVLEIGCAPGKQLAYIGKRFKASIAGLDYSPNGISLSRALCARLRIPADLRCEDIFDTSFEPGSFDLVYSLGVIEHFQDPSLIVRRHLDLVKPGRICLLLIPNFGGVYGRLQNYFDPENLKIHNLDIMTCRAMRQLAPPDLSAEETVFPFGRMSPWLLNIDRKWPTLIAQTVNYLINGVGLIQPFDIKPICPTLVLQITRRP
jgi:2-polyprenyl-3-methyl-5-hydroxy-6-metoxy-1,4-benzoquinol methylase